MEVEVKPRVPTGGESVLQSFVALGGGVIVSRLVAFVGTAYLTRTLGSYAFGIVGLAAAVATFLALALRTGFEPIGAREVARQPHAARRLAAGVGLLRLTIALGSLALLAVGLAFLDKPVAVRQVVMLMALQLLPVALDLSWVYRGLARNRLVGFSMVLSQLVHVAALLALVKGPEDVLWAPLALVLGETVAAVLLALPLLYGRHGGADLRRAWGVLRASGFLVASGLLAATIPTTDVFVVSFLLGESQVGILSASYRICFLILFIGSSLHSAYLPRLARCPPEASATLSGVATRAVESGSALAIPIVVGGWILASPILTALFGPEFAEGREAFRLLLLATGLSFVHGVFFHVLVVFDRTRPELTLRGTAAAINLLLNLLLVPRLGIDGAAAASVLAELIVLIWRWTLGRRLGVQIKVRVGWKAIAAAAGMAAVMSWMVPWVPWQLTLLTGVSAYILLLILLGGYPRDLRPRILGD